MNMDEMLEELSNRRARALAMGGSERVKRQHERGKQSVRERINQLTDEDSFVEYGQLASHQPTHGTSQSLDEISAADGLVFGFGKIQDRMVCVIGEDFTVKGGTYGVVHGEKKKRAVNLAIQERVPVVWLLDGAGARAQEMIGEGLPNGSHYFQQARLSGVAPQVAIVMGPSAGDSSLIASLCEFIIMVKDTSMIAAAGPPVIKAATGQEVDKETLGGASVHCRVSGLADNEAESEEEACIMAQAFLSFLPTNAWAYPPRMQCNDPVNRMDQNLLTLVPENPRKPYDMVKVIESVCDTDSFLEKKPFHARNMITGFARFDGYPVGVLANQPNESAGAITADAARKARHFIDLCSAYHVPLVFLQDVPGVLPGIETERSGALRPALSMTYALAWSQVPKVTVILRKAFGYGAVAMCGGGADQSVVLAWPGADFGSLPASSAVLAAHSRELEESDDPEQLRAELMEYYEASSNAFHAAQTFNIDDVIDPRETRPRIIKALELGRQRQTQAPTPAVRSGVMP